MDLKILIVNYHYIHESRSHRGIYNITPVEFEKQLGAIHSSGYHFVSLEALHNAIKDKNTKKVELNKMSSSDANSKIDFLESDSSIREKISKAFAEPSNPSNTLFLFLKYVIFPINKLKCIDNFTIEREEKYGGNLIYNDLDQITQDYRENKLYPQDLKKGISDWLINFLKPIKTRLNTDEFQNLTKNAYP